MWQRRAFLKAAGAGFVAGLLPRQAIALERADLVYASAVLNPDGRYGAALVTERGSVVSNVTLPDRGHDITWSPLAGRAVVFARQPGTFAVVFDPEGKTEPVTLTSPEGRHFFGHGTFSADGRLLYATENAFETSRSVIGVYDTARGYGRIGEFDTNGIGAHEVLLSSDGALLVVANGGIETHPDYGRAELNLATMDPSLVFIDTRDGHIVGQLRLAADLHQLSIRHLAFDAMGRVWFGCTFKGADSKAPQLVGYATREGEIRLIELPPPALKGLRNYVAALAASRDGSLIAVSSPVGDTVLAIDATTGTPAAILPLRNGSGIAPDGAGFLASSGDGVLEGFSGSDVPAVEAPVKFDNHMRLLAL
jgi:hypothetical protein